MREHLHTATVFTPPSFLGDLAIVPRLAPHRLSTPQNYALRLGQCGIAVPDTPLYRIIVVQPQANAGFADPDRKPSLDFRGHPMPSRTKSTTKKKTRCWPGYEPVPGKPQHSQGSCKPAAKKRLSPSAKKFRSARERQLSNWKKSHPGSPRKRHLRSGRRTRRRRTSR